MNKRRLGGFFALLWLAISAPVFSAELNYGLKPVEVAPGCYALIGSEEYFNPLNGGYIVNTGFIVTDQSVLVIDSGPSLRFGKQLRKVIDEISGNKPIDRVLITHAHPDHYLGNQAFADVPIYGGPKTIEYIKLAGEDFTLNMYRLNGDWMRGTESTAPGLTLTPGLIELGDHRISVIETSGHTNEDYAVFDETCGVLYAGDLVFNARTLSTPHADLEQWKQALMTLKSIDFQYMVPGHGAITDSKDAIDQTIEYIDWLHQTLRQSYDSGLDITEVMQLPIDKRFSNYSLAIDEFQRSVHNLYPAIEANNLPLINEN